MPGRPEPGGTQSLPEREAPLGLRAAARPTPTAREGSLAAPLSSQRAAAPQGGGGRAGDIGQAPRGGRAGLGAHGEPGTRGCGAHSPGSWLRGAGRNAVGSGNWVRPARAAFCSAPGKACPGPRQPVGFAHCTTPGLMSWREAPRRCTPPPDRGGQTAWAGDAGSAPADPLCVPANPLCAPPPLLRKRLGRMLGTVGVFLSARWEVADVS